MRDQVDSQLQDLVTLSSEQRDTLLGALQELLQDHQALQELEDTLEQALDTGLLVHLEGPGGCVLSILKDSTGNLSCSRSMAVFFILGALAGVLCALKSEDVILILSLVQGCGLELEQSGCQLTWDPTVVPQLSALYGCLTGLQLLADPCPGLSRTVSEEETPICP